MISVALYNITMDALALVILGLIAFPFMINKGKFGRLNYTFMWGTVAAFVKCAADLIAAIAENEQWSPTVSMAAGIASYVFACFSFVFFSGYQFLAIKLPRKAARTAIIVYGVFYTLASAMAGYFILRGSLTPRHSFLLFIIKILGLFADCMIVLLYNKAPAKQRLSFAFFSVILSFGSSITYFYPKVPAIQMAYLVAVCLLYINSYIENTNELRSREAELTNSKMEVMISQIQPHFLYNSLSAAASLCHTDPDKAEETITNFGRYLRGNLDSLRQVEPVPFSQELRHIKAYVELEKTRLQSQLNIEYNIGISDFTLPALSVQPLVENAVKHGIAESGDAGTVIITTHEDENNYYVEVIDDGQGFDSLQAEQNPGTHIGIENVQSRLTKMVGGHLDIVSVPGSGTTATVVIPKKRVK